MMKRTFDYIIVTTLSLSKLYYLNKSNVFLGPLDQNNPATFSSSVGTMLPLSTSVLILPLSTSVLILPLSMSVLILPLSTSVLILPLSTSVLIDFVLIDWCLT